MTTKQKKRPDNYPFGIILLIAATIILFIAKEEISLGDGKNSSLKVFQQDVQSKKVMNIAIVMSDSRDVIDGGNDSDSYHRWSFLANLRYAAAQGYQLRYYHLIGWDGAPADPKKRLSCHHPKEGWRASPWCKLLAIHHALQEEEGEYETSKKIYFSRIGASECCSHFLSCS